MPAHAPASGESNPLDLHGVIPPTLTAFDAAEAVDHEVTAQRAAFVVDRGAHGVFTLGTNGEFALLDAAERERDVEVVVDAVDDGAPVIAGVGAPGTWETIYHAERAVAAGADGLVVTPFYYPLDHEGAVRHYMRVAKAVERPIYVSHIPPLTGNEPTSATRTGRHGRPGRGSGRARSALKLPGPFRALHPLHPNHYASAT